MKKKLSFIAYHGAKNKYLDLLYGNFPPKIGRFVDLCHGSMVVSLNVPEYPEHIANDLNYGLHCLFKIIRDECGIFWQEVHRIPCDENTFLNFKKHKPTDDLDWAIRTFVLYRMSMGGRGKSFSKTTRLRRGMNETESKWLSSIDRLPKVSKKLEKVELTCEDFRSIIKRYDGKDTFFYADPPYLDVTRSAKRVYEHEFSEQDHIDLMNLLNSCKGQYLLSGYESVLYTKLMGEPSSKKDVVLHSSSAAKKQQKVECLWRNY